MRVSLILRNELDFEERELPEEVAHLLVLRLAHQRLQLRHVRRQPEDRQPYAIGRCREGVHGTGTRAGNLV